MATRGLSYLLESKTADKRQKETRHVRTQESNGQKHLHKSTSRTTVHKPYNNTHYLHPHKKHEGGRVAAALTPSREQLRNQKALVRAALGPLVLNYNERVPLTRL